MYTPLRVGILSSFTPSRVYHAPLEFVKFVKFVVVIPCASSPSPKFRRKARMLAWGSCSWK